MIATLGNDNCALKFALVFALLPAHNKVVVLLLRQFSLMSTCCRVVTYLAHWPSIDGSWLLLSCIVKGCCTEIGIVGVLQLAANKNHRILGGVLGELTAGEFGVHKVVHLLLKEMVH
jgi:hypothetical protein